MDAVHPSIPRDTTPPSPDFDDALRYWWKLGWISFGGPAGQIAIMYHELVERRRWISEGRSLHALNYCMVLPGPEAQQLATYIGWLMHRTWGGIAAGALFVLPSLVVLIALSWLYMAYGHVPAIAGILYGIKPAITAIVLPADARLSAEPAAKEPEPARNEPMHARLRVEPAHPAAQVTFLHALQGSDGAADPVTRFDAPGYRGVLVRGVAILLPAELGAPAETLTYRAPDGATEQLVAGLTPNGSYDVTTRGRQITIRRGTKSHADEGGVLRGRIP